MIPRKDIEALLSTYKNQDIPKESLKKLINASEKNREQVSLFNQSRDNSSQKDGMSDDEIYDARMALHEAFNIR